MADPPLPKDVLIEVLIRLSVKYLLKFRCVSKSWRDLISSPLFIHRHLKYDRKQKVLLVRRKLPPQGDIFSFHDPDFPEVLVSPNLSIPSLSDFNILSPHYSHLPIHGPCNGLVCIALGKFIFLCNPALREFKLLPPQRFPEGHITLPLGYGFGFDPIGGVYKFIQIWDLSEVPDHEDFLYDPGKSNNRIDLYDSASNSWRQIVAKLPDLRCLLDRELFFDGVIHWNATTAPENFPFILCFDTSMEAFREIHFHDDFSSPECSLRLMLLNDSLAVVRRSQWMRGPLEIEIWVMKEYGVKESWSKQFVVGPYCFTRPLSFLKDEWLLVESDTGHLAACALHKNQFKKSQFYGVRHLFSAVVYEESLISLNQIVSSDRKNE